MNAEQFCKAEAVLDAAKFIGRGSYYLGNEPCCSVGHLHAATGSEYVILLLDDLRQAYGLSDSQAARLVEVNDRDYTSTRDRRIAVVNAMAEMVDEPLV